MLKSTVDMARDLAVVSFGVMIAGFLTRPYKGAKRAIADAASIFFITQVGGVLLKPHFIDESIAYATAAVLGYFAPYIIDLITTLLVSLTAGIKDVDYAGIIKKRLGGRDE